MKTDIKELFDKLDPGELEMLLDGIDGDCDELTRERIRKNALARIGRGKPERRNGRFSRRALIIAAAVVIALCACGCAYVAEAREYNRAMAFFEEHDITAEGLTRAEIKAVYRDIKTESFTYGRTAEVIAHSLFEKRVRGYEIDPELMSPVEAKRMWDALLESDPDRTSGAEGVHYSITGSETDLLMNITANTVSKLDGEEVLWSARLDAFGLTRLFPLADGAAAAECSAARTDRLKLALIDGGGSILFVQDLKKELGADEICSVLGEPDGGASAFALSRSDAGNSVIFARYSRTGELIKNNEIAWKNAFPSFAVHMGKGYLLYAGMNDVVLLDADGIPTGTMQIETEGMYCSIWDIAVYNGRIWLSGVGNPEGYLNLQTYCAKYGIIKALNERYGEVMTPVSSDELVNAAREWHTGLLFVIDENSKAPEVFCSVPGALGRKLTVTDDGRLLWECESIVTMDYVPYRNAYSFDGKTQIMEYAFSEGGELISVTDTGRMGICTAM